MQGKMLGLLESMHRGVVHKTTVMRFFYREAEAW